MSNLVPIVPEKPGEGNTSLSLKKQCSPAIKWCFTLNNYEEKDIKELVSSFSSNCEKFIFENEIGELLTPHLQGYILFKKKRRPSELGITKRIKWIKCDGSEQSNIIYCSKDFRNGVKDVIVHKSKNITIPRELLIIKTLKPWQLKLEKILSEIPNDRTINWIYETTGAVGKSTFAKYMAHTYDALYITEGKKADIINMVYNYVINKELNILILDVPRDNGNKISYKSIEEIKNGMICNTKYETGMKIINSPHVVIFSNSFPEIDKFSLDRWNIMRIENNDLIKE